MDVLDHSIEYQISTISGISKSEVRFVAQLRCRNCGHEKQKESDWHCVDSERLQVSLKDLIESAQFYAVKELSAPDHCDGCGFSQIIPAAERAKLRKAAEDLTPEWLEQQRVA